MPMEWREEIGDGGDRAGEIGEIRPLNDWSEMLIGGADAADEIRAATRAGNPFGDDRFVAELERQAGRPLRRKPPGPQPKSRAASV